MNHPVLGPFANVQDLARYEWGRRFWKLPDMRARLLRHWTDERHPHAERFAQYRDTVEFVLASPLDDAELDAALRASGWSLRAAIREIPPVFGAFWPDSLQPVPASNPATS
jgi:hypothetical protein